MKTLLCAINSKFIHSSLAPWCLFSGVKAFSKTNPQVKVMECTINSDIIDFCESYDGTQPDVIAVLKVIKYRAEKE
jgi:hypothetical protein